MSLVSALAIKMRSGTLRSKLLMGFVVIALMAGVCGGIGAAFVNRIATSVTVFSDVTSPLLLESISLADSSRTMRSIMLRADSGADAVDDLNAQLEKLDADSQSSLRVIRELAARAEVALGLETARQSEQDLVTTLKHMLAGSRREQEIARLLRERAEKYGAVRADIDALLLVTANRAEGRISIIEEHAKVQIQTGRAGADDIGDMLSDIVAEHFPVVQSATKLMREAARTDELVKGLGNPSNGANMAVVEREAVATFATIELIMQKLAGRLRTPEGNAEFVRVRQASASSRKRSWEV